MTSDYISVLFAATETNGRKQMRFDTAVTALNYTIGIKLNFEIGRSAARAHIAIEVARNSLPTKDDLTGTLRDINAGVRALRSSEIEIFPKTRNHLVAAQCSR